ncbi:MAG: DUF1800 domain-containing protein [Acidobacteria bacterium]|nr:DUF1800 domain-containing protein [Acidobacteriota bacterium]
MNKYFYNQLSKVFLVILIATALITNPLPSYSIEKKSFSNHNNSLSQDEKILHVLNRLGYGARPGDVEKVRRLGIEKYIELQLNPEKIDDQAVEARLKSLNTLSMDSQELARVYPQPKLVNDGKKAKLDNLDPNSIDKNDKKLEKLEKLEKKRDRLGINEDEIMGRPGEILIQLSQQQILRSVYSDRQLYEVMVDFWTNHFNVFWAKQFNKYLLTEYIQDTIRPNAMGNFGELLKATAHSPAMLVYLDNWLSVDPNASQKLQEQRQQLKERIQELRERRASQGALNNKSKRQVAEPRLGNRRNQNPMLNSNNLPNTQMPSPLPEENPKIANQGKNKNRGLNENYARELMELHTLGVDGGYTQKDVTEVARCLTGWTIKRKGDESAEFSFNERMHDNGEKTVLGQKISVGGQQDGEKVLDLLLKHPSTARFIATKLTRRFVSDNPPKALVEKVAASFTKTGGDIKSMLRIIFTSSEFFDKENYQNKVKSPLGLVVSALRTVDAETNAGLQIIGALNKMGQPLFLCQPPTGYGDTADKWVNTASLVERLNFGIALSEGKIIGTTSNILRNNSVNSVDQLIELVIRGKVEDPTRRALEQELNGQSLTSDKSSKLMGLLLGSPEFQKM